MRSALNRFWVFSARELSDHRGRAFATVAVVAVATALLVTVLSIIGSIDHSVDTASDDMTGGAALEVAASSDTGFPAGMRGEVAGVPGVAQAVPLIQTPVRSPTGALQLVGTDTSAAALGSPLQGRLEQQGAALLATPDGVLVGPRSGFAAGDTVRVQDTDVTVAGVLDGDVADRFGGGRFVLAPLPLAQRIADKADRLDSVLLVTDPRTDTRAVGAQVSEAVGGRALVGEPAAQRTKASNGVMLIRFVAVSAAGLAFLVSGFLIYTAMSMAVAGRRPRISMLRAIGGSRRSIVGDLLLETAVLALVGALVGAVVGVFLGRFTIGRLPALFLETVSARVEFALPVWAIPVAVVAAVGVCVAAAALAARQVYRVSPVEALAPVGVSRVDRVRPWTRVVAGVAAVVLAIAAFVNATTQPGILANSGITTMFAAEIALGFALGTPIVRAAAWTASRFGGVGAVAAETIRRAPKRSWATVMTVSVAVAATFAVSAGNANAVDSTKDSFASLRDAPVWVSTTAAGTYPTGPRLPADLPGRLAAQPGVGAVVPDQASYVRLGDQQALAFGITPDAVNPLVAEVDPDVLGRVMAGTGAVVSRDLADSLSLHVGDDLTIPTPTGEHRTPVLAEVPYFSALNGAVGLGLPQLQNWFGSTAAATVHLQLRDGADPAAVLDGIRAGLPPGVQAYTGDEAVEGFGRALDQATVLNNLIWVIITIIAAVALFNTLLLSVLERRRELGVLRAIGSSRRFAISMVLAEAAGIAIVGGVLGLIFASVQQVVADLASSRAWNVEVAFEPVPASFALAAGALVVCLLGALPPARHVSRVNIIDAMRNE